MKKKFNEVQSESPLSSSDSSPSKHRVIAKTKRTRQNNTSSSSPIVIKTEPLTSRAKNTGYKSMSEARRVSKRVKVAVPEEVGRETDGSFADIDEFESE
jgi:hypothetical protein